MFLKGSQDRLHQVGLVSRPAVTGGCQGGAGGVGNSVLISFKTSNTKGGIILTGCQYFVSRKLIKSQHCKYPL